MEHPESCTGSELAKSVFQDCEEEMDRYKWIVSQQAGRDLGDEARIRWVREHWWGYLRSRWMEHLLGKQRWLELDKNGDFGLLQKRFQDKALLLDRILDRIKAGQENLHIVNWAIDWGINTQELIEILEALDINSRRIYHRLAP